jgi:hypothetical protein
VSNDLEHHAESGGRQEPERLVCGSGQRVTSSRNLAAHFAQHSLSVAPVSDEGQGAELVVPHARALEQRANRRVAHDLHHSDTSRRT